MKYTGWIFPAARSRPGRPFEGPPERAGVLVNDIRVISLGYQSEGFPLTGYFVPVYVGIWAWASQKNCRRVVVAVAAVGVSFLNARFSKEKLHKMMFFVENLRSSNDLVKENSLIYIEFT